MRGSFWNRESWQTVEDKRKQFREEEARANVEEVARLENEFEQELQKKVERCKKRAEEKYLSTGKMIETCYDVYFYKGKVHNMDTVLLKKRQEPGLQFTNIAWDGEDRVTDSYYTHERRGRVAIEIKV